MRLSQPNHRKTQNPRNTFRLTRGIKYAFNIDTNWCDSDHGHGQSMMASQMSMATTAGCKAEPMSSKKALKRFHSLVHLVLKDRDVPNQDHRELVKATVGPMEAHFWQNTIRYC